MIISVSQAWEVGSGRKCKRYDEAAAEAEFKVEIRSTPIR